MSERTTQYYDETAGKYDDLHGEELNPEHLCALERAWPIIDGLTIESIADIGCGTGRSISWLRQKDSSLHLIGVDPSVGVLELAQQRVPGATFEIGCGEKLPFDDNSVDMAIATGIMHHVDNPAQVIKEMFRISRRAVLISDHNNFAFGGDMARRARILLHALGLLGIATFIKQGFRKQGYSDDDGWWYPYSILDNYSTISSLSEKQYIIPTRPMNSKKLGNFMLNQSHMAILAIKHGE